MSGISIIIPTYNMRLSLLRCVQSVAAQTLKPVEVIVVDDGSIDGTKEYLNSVVGANSIRPRSGENDIFPYTMIRQDHAGASAARNRGFAESKGEYVMFLDADVVLKKHALQRFFETLTQNSILKTQNLGIGYAYSAFKWGWKKFSSFPFNAERLRQMPYIHTTSLIRRDILPEKPFDESLKRLQDWDLYLTLLEKGIEGIYLPEILFSVETKGTMSNWLPSLMYHLPLSKVGIKMPSLEKYRNAEQSVRAKHKL